MSAKNQDRRNNWRCRNLCFRLSEAENEQLNTFVQLSGLTKQDYVTHRVLNRDIVVQGSPRIYKALKDQFGKVLDELSRIEAGSAVSDELLETIQMIASIMDGMKEESA